MRTARLCAALSTVVVTAVVAAGCGAPSGRSPSNGPVVMTSPSPSPSTPPGAAAETGPTTKPKTGPSGKDEGPQPIPASTRVRVTSLRIPAIHLSTTRLEHLALGRDDELSAPVDPDRAGWYAAGVVPGDVGPAVIAGHVDSRTGPAVFVDLGELSRGARIEVGRSDGTTARFVVDKVVHAPKADFPTDRVYGPTPDAQLRLITCSGPYDRSSVGYLDNTVVFATLAA